MESDDLIPKIPDKATTSKVLSDLRELFKPILAKLSKDQRKTLAEIDQHIFPLHNPNSETHKSIEKSDLVDTNPKRNNKKSTNDLDNLFCIQLIHKRPSQIDQGEYDEELYY
ncbi:MAG: hypothetical protein JWN56_2135 [Sphingobacteriales bacterium]|nr:hypothetical protein [Sphingobacteriales bacterium]